MTYPISKRVLFPIFRFFVRKTVGMENLPPKGPFILACKHMGPLDGIFIAMMIIPRLNQKIRFVANIARWGWFWEKVVSERWAGCIPFYKENPRICLDIAQDYLRKGKIVGIFPEGILQDYNPSKVRVKTGVARLAVWAKVPIVPVGLKHDVTVRPDLPKLLRRRQAIKNILFNPHSLEIHIGKPFELTQYYDQPLTHDILVEATNKVMERVDTLSNIHRHLTHY